MTRKYLTYSLLFFLFASKVNAGVLTDTVYLKSKPTVKEQMYKAPMIIKTSPTAYLFGGIFPITAEYRLIAEITSGIKQSDQFGVSFLGKSLFLNVVENLINVRGTRQFRVSGIKIQYAHKFFLGRKNAPYGFYMGPMVSFSNARLAVGINNLHHQAYYDFRHFDVNLLFGIQKCKSKWFTVDWYAGIGYKKNETYYHANSFNIRPYDTRDYGTLYNNDVNLICGVNIGFSLK